MRVGEGSGCSYGCALIIVACLVLDLIAAFAIYSFVTWLFG